MRAESAGVAEEQLSDVSGQRGETGGVFDFGQPAPAAKLTDEEWLETHKSLIDFLSAGLFAGVKC